MAVSITPAQFYDLDFIVGRVCDEGVLDGSYINRDSSIDVIHTPGAAAEFQTTGNVTLSSDVMSVVFGYWARCVHLKSETDAPIVTTVDRLQDVDGSTPYQIEGVRLVSEHGGPLDPVVERQLIEDLIERIYWQPRVRAAVQLLFTRKPATQEDENPYDPYDQTAEFAPAL